MITKSDLPAVIQANVNSYNAAKKRQSDLDLEGQKSSSAMALQKYLQQGKDRELGELTQHHRAVEATQQQQADTMEEYRIDQGARMDSQNTTDKLKLFLGGGAGGTIGAEQQKNSNLVDAARNSLNASENLVKENPKTYGAYKAIQGIPLVGSSLANLGAGWGGGKFKEIRDTEAIAKESMQNVMTGAAASGEQVPAFQGFSGPGAWDAFQGKAGNSDNTRDALNSFQQRQDKSKPKMTPELMQAAGLANDPIAQAAIKQQQASEAASLQQKMQKVAPQDQEAAQWLRQNSAHPDAAGVKRKLALKYGNIF